MRRLSALTGLLLASALAFPALASPSLAFPAQAAQAAPAAPAAPDSIPALTVQASARTHHTVTIRGATVPYTADVEQTLVKDSTGADAATVITTSYLRRHVKDATARPVIFIFNGGPGASSSPMLTQLSPVRMETQNGKRKLVANPYTPLDAMDMVFIDPVGTGFSRALPGHDGKAFWGVASDGAEVASVIHNWLRVHHREGSPYYIAGESYGTNRASELSQAKYHLHPNGIMLISLYAPMQNDDMWAMSYLPSLAAVAAYHGKNQIKKDPQAAYDEAVIFARNIYLPALVQGSALPGVEKEKIADEMAKRIGISADIILKKDLKPGPYGQMLNILKDKGLRIGQSDARVTGKLSVYGGKKQPFDDPSLGNAITGGSTGDILKAYYRDELGYKTDEKYITLNMNVNSAWDYTGKENEPAFHTPISLIIAAMAKNPRLRLFWIGGMFDLRTPLYSGIYALTHAGIPANRLTMVKMPSGHGVYEGDTNLKLFTRDLRDFVTAK